MQDSPASVFEAGETLEFRQQDYVGAMAAFRSLARSKDPLIRAGALLRLGRNLCKNNQVQEALAVYEELARLGSTPVGGDPAELLAREQSMSISRSAAQVAAIYRGLLLRDGWWE